MTPSDVQTIDLWLPVLNVIWTGALTLMIWLRKPGLEAKNEIKQLEQIVSQRQSSTAERLREIEIRLEHVAGSEQLKEVEGSIKQMVERNASLADRIVSLSNQLARVESLLLHRGHER